MVDEGIVSVVGRYLTALRHRGIEVDFGVIFGSHVTGEADEWSDIDLLVVSPRFDTAHARKDVDTLWDATVGIDNRIEPIPCGLRQWEEDDVSTIVEIARREGRQVRIPEAA